MTIETYFFDKKNDDGGIDGGVKLLNTPYWQNLTILKIKLEI